MDIFRLTQPSSARIPILLSIPHCGTSFPDELRCEYVPELIGDPDDTDWHLDRLYDFAPSMGITVISAVMSRWVIDLNRHPESKPLYHDGRIITDICPVTTFLGYPLYRDKRTNVAEHEILRRRQAYYDPYHEKLRQVLSDLKAEFGRVLLWDCHSIRQTVPTIQKERFPDLVLGSSDGASSHRELIATALRSLANSGYSLSHNEPFKGGYITRLYGQPLRNEHALQLEMCKINYMDDEERTYHPARSEKLIELLRDTFGRLCDALISLKD